MRFSSRTLIPLALTFIIVGAALSTPSQSAEYIVDPDESWTVPQEQLVPGTESALFSERSSQDRPFSALLDPSKLDNNQLDPTCLGLDDPKCTLTDFLFWAQVPVCQTSVDMNCIETIGAIDSNGIDHPGSFQRYYPLVAQNKFSEDQSVSLPRGGTGSIFTIPGVSGPAGDAYYVSLVMSGQGRKGETRKVSLHSITAQISPVQIQPTQFNKSGCLEASGICNIGWVKLQYGDGYQYNESGSLGLGCVVSSYDENSCAKKEAFPDGYRFYLRARLTLNPSGWLHGRMANPDISITQQNGVTQLVVSAAPVAVPVIFKTYRWSEMPTELQSIYDPTTGRLKGFPKSEGGFFSHGSTDPLERAWTVGPAPYEETAFTEINAWLPYVNNKATVTPHYWSFRSLTPGELTTANKCFSDSSQLNGIVTTNSTVYSPGPPTFDKGEGNLNYQVAAPHYTNKDEVFKGTYDLVMRSTVARCVYGFSKAPIKATISVVSASGSPQIATTVVNETDGWLHLSANGFEFSSPTVKVNLAQDAPAPEPTVTPTPEPTATPTIAPVRSKKMTIKCVKGKIVRTVTSTKPSCPKNYTKK